MASPAVACLVAAIQSDRSDPAALLTTNGFSLRGRSPVAFHSEIRNGERPDLGHLGGRLNRSQYRARLPRREEGCVKASRKEWINLAAAQMLATR